MDSKVTAYTLDNKKIVDDVQSIIEWNLIDFHPWKALSQHLDCLGIYISGFNVDFDSEKELLSVACKVEIEFEKMELTEELKENFDEYVKDWIVSLGEAPESCDLKISGGSLSDFSVYKGVSEIKDLIPSGSV